MRGRPQYVTAVLRVIAEPRPAAYYACQLCHYTASVQTKNRRDTAKVAAFVADIRTSHRATCPALHPERTQAA